MILTVILDFIPHWRVEDITSSLRHSVEAPISASPWSAPPDTGHRFRCCGNRTWCLCPSVQHYPPCISAPLREARPEIYWDCPCDLAPDIRHEKGHIGKEVARFGEANTPHNRDHRPDESLELSEAFHSFSLLLTIPLVNLAVADK